MSFLDQLLKTIIEIQYMVSFALEFVACPKRIHIVHEIHIPIWEVQKVLKPREVTLFESKKKIDENSRLSKGVWSVKNLQKSMLCKRIPHLGQPGESKKNMKACHCFSVLTNLQRQNLPWLLDV